MIQNRMRSLVKIPAVSGIVLALAGFCAAAGISVTPNTWNPGTVGSGLSYTSNFVVENTGFEMLNVKVKGNNSANWTLASNIGYNQFWIRFDTSGDFSYTNFTTAYQDDTSGTNNMINKKYGQTFNLYIHLTAPTGSSTVSTQTVTIDIQGTTDDFWTYNTSGGFYWRNVGNSGAPDTDWATSSSTIMTSSKWQYMTNPSSGWRSFGAIVTNSFTTLQTFVADNIRTGGNGNVIAGTCYYTHNSLRTWNFTSSPNNAARSRRVSFVKYTIGTLINSALATNTYATRSVLVPSLVMTSEDAVLRSYSLTFCSHCGYVPSMVTNNGGFAATVPERTIVQSHFSIGTPPARIIVLN